MRARGAARWCGGASETAGSGCAGRRRSKLAQRGVERRARLRGLVEKAGKEAGLAHQAGLALRADRSLSTAETQMLETMHACDLS